LAVVLGVAVSLASAWWVLAAESPKPILEGPATTPEQIEADWLRQDEVRRPGQMGLPGRAPSKDGAARGGGGV
jgi:hypothetical protein